MNDPVAGCRTEGPILLDGRDIRGEMVECGDTQAVFGGAKDPRTKDYIRGRFG